MLGTEFIPGDQVEKCTGDYFWRGEVRAVFSIYDGGPIRIIVAHTIPSTDGKGHVLHIYAPKNIRHIK